MGASQPSIGRSQVWRRSRRVDVVSRAVATRVIEIAIGHELKHDRASRRATSRHRRLASPSAPASSWSPLPSALTMKMLASTVLVRWASVAVDVVVDDLLCRPATNDGCARSPYGDDDFRSARGA